VLGGQAAGEHGAQRYGRRAGAGKRTAV